MGDVIRRNAAVDTIIADVKKSYANAVAKGGVWQAIAEERLAPVLQIIDAQQVRYAQTDEALVPLLARVHAANQRADNLIGRVSDDIWNAVGRPAQDPALSILFPGGIGYYTEGDVEDQPNRMELLVELLKSQRHPKLSKELAERYAAEVQTMADELRRTVEPAAKGRRQRELLERVRTAVARSAQMELAAVKRRYKAEGFSEAEIHAVIPDRSRPEPKREE